MTPVDHSEEQEHDSNIASLEVSTPQQSHACVAITDPKWSQTLPHLVTPRGDMDESLPGLLLRCDEINGWPSGATLGLLADSLRERQLMALRVRHYASGLLVPLD
jgi:hypothetical protein